MKIRNLLLGDCGRGESLWVSVQMRELVQNASGPWPMQLVVVMAVRKAVSAATMTFTAISIKRFFMILHSSLFILHLDLIAVTVVVAAGRYTTTGILAAAIAGIHATTTARILRIILVLLMIVGEVLGQLGHVAGLGQLGAGELSSGTGAHVHAVDVLRGGELLRGRRTLLLRLDACGEDGQPVELHGLALQHQLTDAADHVGQHALDGSPRVRSVMLRHVLGQLFNVDGLADGHGAGEPLAVGHAVRILVLILTIKYTHNSLFFIVLDSVATSYIGWPPPALCRTEN